MADQRRWGKWDGPEAPEGEGGLGSGSAPAGGSEAEGRGRQFVATCVNCGATSYIGGDWKWFTCWKCGAMSSEMIA
jgi:ribosomal protein S27AE